jgi:hypothetical protein
LCSEVALAKTDCARVVTIGGSPTLRPPFEIQGDAFPARVRAADGFVWDFLWRKAIHDPTYRAAASKTKNLIPVHSEIDSNMPPTIAPNRLEPSASGENLDSAKLLMNTIPAKKTGRQRTRVAAKALAERETRKIERVGTR